MHFDGARLLLHCEHCSAVVGELDGAAIGPAPKG
jgi:hypothetical protein